MLVQEVVSLKKEGENLLFLIKMAESNSNPSMKY